MKLKEAISTYINYRRVIGEKYETGAKHLFFLIKRVGEDMNLEDMTPEIVSDYLYGGHNMVNATWFIRYGVIKGFFLWAKTRGLFGYIPLLENKPIRPPHLQPYIYSDDELKRLFEGALNYRIRRKKKEQLYPQCVQMSLILCYVLGLRLSEATGLHMKDVDTDERLAYIRDTKFYKSRVVPFNNCIKNLLCSFLDWRKAEGLSQELDTSLFLDTKGNPLKNKTIEGIFLRLRTRLGIFRNDIAQQPRIHDLRHTFAVKRLTSWYREGADVQQLLPILSTYMGHSHLRNTTVYLAMTDGLLGAANKRFETYAEITENHEEE
ncbi:MAG: tyrosine-type recombinase/integrase [Muribaculaceae bacterium]